MASASTGPSKSPKEIKDVNTILQETLRQTSHLKDSEQAMRLFEEAIKNVEIGAYTDFRLAAGVCRRASALCMELQQFKRAAEILTLSFRVKKRHLYKDHANFAPEYTSLGHLAQTLGRSEDAIAMYLKVVQLKSDGTGQPNFKDPVLDCAYKNLANLYLDKGDWAKALFHFQRAYACMHARRYPSKQMDKMREILAALRHKLDASVHHGLEKK